MPKYYNIFTSSKCLPWQWNECKLIFDHLHQVGEHKVVHCNHVLIDRYGVILQLGDASSQAEIEMHQSENKKKILSKYLYHFLLGNICNLTWDLNTVNINILINCESDTTIQYWGVETMRFLWSDSSVVKINQSADLSWP